MTTMRLRVRSELRLKCEIIPGLQVYFPMPAPADDPMGDQPWYGFDFGPVHFTVMSTEHGKNTITTTTTALLTNQGGLSLLWPEREQKRGGGG
jgi:hypothetical protein